MKQVLHIFRKDARHYWRESVISIALMAAYAWYEMRGWTDDGIMGYSGFRGLLTFSSLSGLVSVLLPISWVIVIVRVIQGESLVGDRQFWITRPYEWKNLLAAKILFILAVVNLPLLIADIFLLWKAGFQPTHYLTGLLWMQLMLILFLLIAIASLASVTANVLQFSLAALALFIYLVAVSWLASKIPSSSFSGPADSVQGVLLIATSIAVIAIQYARRKTVSSRWIIAGLAAVIVVIVVATPYGMIVAHDYPQLSGQPPMQVSLQPPAKQIIDGAISDDDEEAEIDIPLGVSGIAGDSVITVSGAMVAIEGSDGLRWNSGWRSTGWSLFRESGGTVINFSLKKRLFDRIKSQPVKTNISLALAVYHDQNRSGFVIPKGEFVMPDVGLCIAQGWDGWQPEIVCRTALRTPSSVLLTYDLSRTTCPNEGEFRAKPGDVSRAWSRNSDSGPADFGISPVKTIRFGTTHTSSNARAIGGFCAGTPVVISHPEFVESTRMDLELTGLHLGEYRTRSIRGATWR